MKRLTAILTTAVLTLGGVAGSITAANAADDEASTISDVTTSWSDGTVAVGFAYDTWDYARVDVTVGDTAVASKALPEFAAARTSVTFPRAIRQGPATIAVRMTSCDADPADPGASCTTSTAYSGTLLSPKTVPKGKANALTLLNALTVTTESHAGSYRRSKFKIWNDANRDGENTRAEVLKSESRITASLNRHGTVKGGKWISAYDNTIVSKASRLDVDHMVPLAEAWASGAWKWNAKKREAFGNDLGYGASLIAVSMSSNRSKGDSDPAEWMPKASSFACAYAKQFIAVKARWKLSIDPAEKAALTGSLAKCSSYAVVKPGTPKISALVERPKKAKPVGSSSSGGSSNAYYANCDAVRAAGAAPLRAGQPGYETPRLDRDGDGVACE